MARTCYCGKSAYESKTIGGNGQEDSKTASSMEISNYLIKQEKTL